jgi:hypothetical protein
MSAPAGDSFRNCRRKNNIGGDFPACQFVSTMGRTEEQMSETPASRRDFLFIATGGFAGVGAIAAPVPMVPQMEPDASTLTAGGPVEFEAS